MLDSPYVRRAAVTLECLGIPFVHEPVSVFTTFGQFQQINPVVKAPTLVLDDGTVLMDSTLIIDWAEGTLPAARSLWSADSVRRTREYRAVGLALAACEKSIQRVYEKSLRPEQFQFLPWIERVTGQLQAAFAALESAAARETALLAQDRSHATIAAAIAWQFAQSNMADVVPARTHPVLSAASARMEAHPTFRKYPPDGPGVPAGTM